MTLLLPSIGGGGMISSATKNARASEETPSLELTECCFTTFVEPRTSPFTGWRK